MERLAKIILYSIEKIKRLQNYILNTLLLNSSNVQFIERPKINGKIIIKNKGNIYIGKGILINNDSNFNPAGIKHPTILCTQNKTAIINIGNHVGISGTSIVANQSITIGNYVLIGTGVAIWDTDFHPLNPEKRRIDQTDGAQSAPIFIEDDVFIGANCIILKGVTIGKGAVIGAGCVVSRNVPPYATAFGNPMVIKLIGNRI